MARALVFFSTVTTPPNGEKPTGFHQSKPIGFHPQAPAARRRSRPFTARFPLEYCTRKSSGGYASGMSGRASRLPSPAAKAGAAFTRLTAARDLAPHARVSAPASDAAVRSDTTRVRPAAETDNGKKLS
ncbi:hypothetical protein GCM10023097_20150 [Streptomyces collinus]